MWQDLGFLPAIGQGYEFSFNKNRNGSKGSITSALLCIWYYFLNHDASRGKAKHPNTQLPIICLYIYLLSKQQ